MSLLLWMISICTYFIVLTVPIGYCIQYAAVAQANVPAWTVT